MSIWGICLHESIQGQTIRCFKLPRKEDKNIGIIVPSLRLLMHVVLKIVFGFTIMSLCHWSFKRQMWLLSNKYNYLSLGIQAFLFMLDLPCILWPFKLPRETYSINFRINFLFFSFLFKLSGTADYLFESRFYSYSSSSRFIVCNW